MAGKKLTIEVRFWSGVKYKHPDKCWRWRKAKYKNGYGVFGSFDGKNTGAHRISYIIHYGSIPDGLCVLHRCDNPSCVNPNHLFLGTHSDNARDKLSKGRDHNQRKTHCKHGHPFSGDNLFINKRNARVCRICRNHASKIAKRIKRAQIRGSATP